jgi:heme/copper-type cytochrome/quinol oxidase subunit 2
MARKFHVKPTRNTWTELLATLQNRHFWVLMGMSAVVMGVAGLLLWLAIRNWDSAMTSMPKECRRWGNTDWSILAMAIVAPFFAISILGAISELWHNLERRHKHISTHWRPFAVFTGLVFGLGGLLIVILHC